MKRLPRPFASPEGGRTRVKFKLLPICACTSRRGPEGGVCGICGNAIPSPTEAGAKRLEAGSFPRIPHDPLPDIT